MYFSPLSFHRCKQKLSLKRLIFDLNCNCLTRHGVDGSRLAHLLDNGLGHAGQLDEVGGGVDVLVTRAAGDGRQLLLVSKSADSNSQRLF